MLADWHGLMSTHDHWFPSLMPSRAFTVVAYLAPSKISKVIMLPVFPIMALSGPLFTEMNDGEALQHGAAAVVLARLPTPLACTI